MKIEKNLAEKVKQKSVDTYVEVKEADSEK